MIFIGGLNNSYMANYIGGTMKKTFSILSIFLSSIFLYRCATLQPIYYGTYNIELTQVERPAHAKQRYGEIKITPVTEGGISKYSFEDDMVKILWLVTAENISFLLENKTDYSIKIIWDEAAYVDENGVSQRVMHSGVKYNDRENTQPPSVVVRKGKIEDVVVPTNLVYYEEGYYGKYFSSPGGWKEKPLFNYYQIGGNETSIKQLLKSNVGKTFQVLLPLKIEETVNDYIFTFTIKDYTYKGQYK